MAASDPHFCQLLLPSVPWRADSAATFPVLPVAPVITNMTFLHGIFRCHDRRTGFKEIAPLGFWALITVIRGKDLRLGSCQKPGANGQEVLSYAAAFFLSGKDEILLNPRA